jgi:hypothetical protein
MHRTLAPAAAFAALAGFAIPAMGQCPPAAPHGVTASHGTECSSIYVDWPDVPGANIYNIYASYDNAYSSSHWVGSALFGASHFREVFPPGPSPSRYYWVTATHNLCFPGSGTSGPSNAAYGWGASLPNAPTDVWASEGECGGVRVTWRSSEVSTNGQAPTTYRIYRNTVNFYPNSSEVGSVSYLYGEFLDSTAVEGQTYWYWVRAENACGPTPQLIGDAGYAGPPRPANDLCSNAIVVSAGTTYDGSTSCAAANGPTAGACGAGPTVPDVWYRFNATAPGTLHADTCSTGFNFDTVLAVYGQACPGANGTPIACNSHACGHHSSVDAAVAAGTSYFIRVSGVLASPVAFRLHIDFTPSSACYANCDASTTAPVLNVLDFNCFLSRFAAGNAYANCDGSTVAPVLNVLDFNCFLTRFAAGCP